MPEQRLQRTREAYVGMTLSELLDGARVYGEWLKTLTPEEREVESRRQQESEAFLAEIRRAFPDPSNPEPAAH